MSLCTVDSMLIALKVTDDDFQLFSRLRSTAARRKDLELLLRPSPLLVETLTQFLE